MGLADKIAHELNRPGGRRMRCDELLEELSGADRKAFLDALEDPDVPARVISRALESEGRPLVPDAIIKWRRRHGVEVKR